MIRKLVLILFLVFTREVYSQDLLADLNEMHNNYSKLDLFKTEILLDIYNDKSSTAAFMKKKATVNKNGNNFYYTIDDIEMLMTEKCLIMVYNTQKKILYREVQKEEFEAITKNMYTSSLDSTVLNYDSVKFYGTTDNLKKYTIYTSKKMIMKTDLFLNSSTKRIDRIIYYYNPKLYNNLYKVIVKFKDLPSDQISTTADFNEGKYITRIEKTIKVSSKYNNYELSIISDEK